MNHILIAYFSRAGENYFGGKIKSVEVGNTEICAKELKKAIEADLFKIEMKEPYSEAPGAEKIAGEYRTL